MTTLITMARTRMPDQLHRRLAQREAVIYCPVLRLIPCAFDESAVRRAGLLVVTSDMGLMRLATMSGVRQTPMICVSQRLARRAQGLGFTKIQAAPQASRASAFTLVGQREATWVTGARSPAAPANIHTVVSYRSQVAPEKVASLKQQVFTQALITAPSVWQALVPLWQQGPAPRFFALGASTHRAIQASGFTCMMPQVTSDVLAATVALMTD